ncbi:M4 family metallopeptidase [Tumebacillus sp. DT12]|uniref:Neutral metalloproteinase n=1 Tax=Tumebacillus lacus TaxID=2995335 RepID=A0ABT3WZL1_9BACL|nr:M4 family metallopeptidase [Tumebacillus lacus]MCX7569651.1 M4 family metallopeptidase [Tumebacillus lacus]
MNKKMITTLVLSSLVASAFAMNAGAAPDKQVLKDEKGSVHTVAGSLGKVSGATAEERAFAALEKVKGDFGFDNAKASFKVKKSHKDEMGTTHTKLDQTINGITVFGEQLIVHEADGNVQGVTGTFAKVTASAKKANLKASAAIEKAVAHTGFTGELIDAPTAELVYLPQGDTAVLTYLIGVSYMGEEAGNWQIFVNALDGTVVDAINKIEHAGKPGGGSGSNAVGSGTGVLGDKKSINTTYQNGTYYLIDNTKFMAAKGGTVTTKSYNNGSSTMYDMTDADNNYADANQRAGVDAHYYAGFTYDYFYNKLGRNSFDGNGTTLLSAVRYGVNYNNAFWNGRQMTYGDGDGVNFRAFSGALDVVAHELAHGVTDTASGLVYRDQSGALNESFSDAMGAAIEGRNWLLGEDICLPGGSYSAFRSMSDPNAYGDPAHMSEYVNTSSDNGGVHTNSGIPNKAFYNLSTSVNSRDIAAKIWYTANRDYMTSRTNFSGARAATLQAAAALYGSGSTQYTAVANSWSAVGVY